MKSTSANFIIPKKLELHKISFFSKTKFFPKTEKMGGGRRSPVTFTTHIPSICTHTTFLKSIS